MSLDLDSAYAELPTIECKGLCYECCGGIRLAPQEARRIAVRGKPVPRMVDFPCPLLDFMGRCSAYDVRPMICRLWGVVESMPCPHGCKPQPRYLTHEEGFEFLRRSGLQ